MIKQVAQTGIIKAFRQRQWRKLVSVLVLLLLFTHQTWAGGLCFCEPEGKAPNSGCHTMLPPDKPKAEAPHSGCHTAHFPGRTTVAMPEVATPQSTHRRSEAEPPAAQPEKLANSTMICCHLQPDAEAQAIPVTARNQGPILTTLPIIHCGAQPNSAPLPDNFHHPHQHQKRPLYLSYSCLLI